MVSMRARAEHSLAGKEKERLEEQLRHMQRMEAVGHLAAGIAHEFNNILTALMGFACMLESRAEDPRQRRSVEQILLLADRAANLTRGLLAFSRRHVIEIRRVDLNETIKSFGKILAKLIGEDVELKIRLSAEDITVMADAGQIEQVLMNLATNARDAMPQGGFFSISTEVVRIHEGLVNVNGLSTPGTYALISVSDTGSGMDPATLVKIFDPFFTTKEVGKGTTFRIYLPVADEKPSEVPAEKLLPAPGGTETVLFADDDPEILDMMSETLSMAGYTVIEAADGNEPLRRFKENKDRVQLVIW